MTLAKIFAGLALFFDVIALAFVLLAGLHMIYTLYRTPKLKGSLSLSHKNYHHLRSRFMHRIIISLDFFLVADLIKLSFAADTETLIQILLIVIIRTILSFFLVKEIDMHS
jgi:uncharacterized membrane protein